MSKLRCAVLGTGYLGRFHVQKYLKIPEVELVGIYDIYQPNADLLAEELGVRVFSCLEELLELVDAVSIAASTSAHFELAKLCLERDIHVLLEKPMTCHYYQARILWELAESRNLILQIGHLERYNPAYQNFQLHLQQPLRIEMQRLSLFNKRGSDVSVILDLMIHDLDILLSWVKSPIVKLQATGLSVVTSDLDVASAAIVFANHCVANLTASRVHTGVERVTRVFQAQNHFVLDFQAQSLTKCTFDSELKTYHQESIFCERTDALQQQILAFVAAIIKNAPVMVDAYVGLTAMELAEKIQNSVQLSKETTELV